jgi:hypothetical protein
MVRTDDTSQECYPEPPQSLESILKNHPESGKETLETVCSERYKVFAKAWASSTEDNDLSLYGFRRFKTTHLMNLRLLEEEIYRMDHQIYQAGLKLGIDRTPRDRLGLKYCKLDEHSLSTEEVMDEKFVLKLRDLIKQYGKSTL